MKNLFVFLLLALFLPMTQAQEEKQEVEMLGDNFSLEGALELFKISESLEDFEKRLNEEGNEVNNLDLNDDEETDYIRVEDIVEDDVHIIVLQAVLADGDEADIAIIELERIGEESASLQIIGDDELYGEEYIVEPFEVEGSSTGKGPSDLYKLEKIIVNVWLWPSVRYVYRPGYTAYVSPFRWRLYPGWYRPFKPRPYRVFAPIRLKHRSHHHVVTTRRCVKANKIYTHKRKSSVLVKKKTTVLKSRDGKKVKKSKTTKTKVAKDGRKKDVKKSKKKTKVKKKGN